MGGSNIGGGDVCMVGFGSVGQRRRRQTQTGAHPPKRCRSARHALLHGLVPWQDDAFTADCPNCDRPTPHSSGPEHSYMCMGCVWDVDFFTARWWLGARCITVTATLGGALPLASRARAESETPVTRYNVPPPLSPANLRISVRTMTFISSRLDSKVIPRRASARR